MATENKKRSSSIVPSGDSTTYAAPSSGDYMPLHPSARSWELNRKQVKILKVIGKGAFSQVAKATAWNISGDEEYSTVAVKMLKGAIRNFKLWRWKRMNKKDLLFVLFCSECPGFRQKWSFVRTWGDEKTEASSSCDQADGMRYWVG